MKNKNYRITLTPVDKFFFGGDMTFQVGDKEDDVFNTQYSSYIIQSARFPQQTSLLGMLRFLILSNAEDMVFKDNKIIDKNGAETLIGNRSFTINSNNTVNKFGKIKRISHVRISRNNIELEFAPLFGTIDFNQCTNGTYNIGSLKVPTLSKKQYDAKDGLETLLIPKSDIDNYFYEYEKISIARKEKKKKDKPNLPKPPYQLDDIFIEDRRIGIARNLISGKTEDNALFKQISYRFNNKEADICFVFEVEVEDIALEKYNGQMVTVGGDNSQFIIDIMPIDAIEKETDEDNNAHAISLLSPAYLTRKDVKENSTYAVTSLMPFRFLTDKNDNKNDDKRSYHVLNSKLERSDRYELYAPGTVFYFEKDTQRKALVKALKNKEDFRQIGYNEYKSIK